MSKNGDLRISGLARDILNDEWQRSAREDSQGYSYEPWSLGRLGDLFWRHSIRSRPMILSRIVGVFEDAMDRDRMPFGVLPNLLLADYWDEILMPLLDSSNDRDTELRQELIATQRIIAATKELEEEYLSSLLREMLVERISREPYATRLRKLAPDLYKMVRSSSLTRQLYFVVLLLFSLVAGLSGAGLVLASPVGGGEGNAEGASGVKDYRQETAGFKLVSSCDLRGWSRSWCAH
jgi:hypothetical protein